MMNVFWSRLDVCADDVIFSQESKSLCELGDPSEFIAYGEARCQRLGLYDDEEAASFLSQAFQGDVQIWYDSLNEDVQSSWSLLKHALVEEFGDGQVMESMQLLLQVWWQVPNFEQCFETLWKVYERVSFFHGSFVQLLKERMLEKHKVAKGKLQDLCETQVVDHAFQCCEDSTDADSSLEDQMSSQSIDMYSSSSSLLSHDESEAMDDLSSDEATSVFDEESLYASSIDESDEADSVTSEESMHDVKENEALFKEESKKCGDLVIDGMHIDDSFDDTKGEGNEDDLTLASSRHEKIIECMEVEVEDTCVYDACKDFLVFGDRKEDDLWEIPSLYEQEHVMKVDASAIGCVGKVTKRIEDALGAEVATHLETYDPVHMINLVEEEVLEESHYQGNAWEIKEINEFFFHGADLEHEEVDVDALVEQHCHDLLIMMVMHVAMQYVMQEFCDSQEVNISQDICFETMQPYGMGDYNFMFDEFVHDKASTLRNWDGCQSSFSFDPGGWDRHVVMVDWETCIWPFDPGGSFLLLIMNDLAG